ncbi:MAG: ABC transporter permease [Pseudothermotoga sp.]
MKYFLQRMLFYLFTIFVAITLNFLIPRLMPGDPAERILSRYEADPNAIAAMKIALGIETDKPLLDQYVEYLKNTLRGNFGISYVYYPVKVQQVIQNALPWTVGLVGISTLISFVIGTLLGVYAGWNRERASGISLLMISILLRSIPYFWLAMLMVYVFGFRLKWFPIAGAYSSRQIVEGFQFVKNVLFHGFLPSITLIIASLGGWILTMRNNMVAILSEDFVLLAEAKGLKKKDILLRYAARNAMLPSFTAFGLSLGFVVSGALLTEIVFSYPGVGFTLYRAVISQDYPLIQALFLIISLSVLTANLIVDLTYGFLDPRVRV